MRILYIADTVTRELIKTYESQVNPVRPDTYIEPSPEILFTANEPLEAEPGKYNYLKPDLSWELRVDTRGIWYKPDHQIVEIKALTEVIDPTWSRTDPPQTIDDIKDLKRTDIRLGYEAACNAKVLALSVLWDGGFESAIKLDAAKRLNEAAGLPTVTFFDSSNEPHVCSFEDAMTIIVTVAADYQAKLAKKQGYFKQILDATQPEDIADIVWEDD